MIGDKGWRAPRVVGLLVAAATLLSASLPIHAAGRATSSIRTIRVLPQPTLLALDPHTDGVYVRSKGLTDRYGNTYAKSGFTMLDGRSGRVLHTWHDMGGNPSITIDFLRTSNGLRTYTTAVPALARISAQVGVGKSTNTVDEIDDLQSGWVAIVTTPIPATASATEKLWSFDLKSRRLRATTMLSSTEVGMAIDAPAKRLLVYLDGASQLFTLDTLRQLASLPNGGPQGYPLPPATANPLDLPYDPEPIAIDMTLGRAIILYGSPNGPTAELIDIRNGHTLYTVPVGQQPIAVQTDSLLHRAYIIDYQSDDATVVDLRTGKQVADVQVGSEPSSLAVDTHTGEVFVANSGVGDNTVTMFPANITQQ